MESGVLIALLMIPLFTASLVIATFEDVKDNALDVSNTSLRLVQEMNKSIDCAFKGIELSVCSPDLFFNFDNQTKDYQNTITAHSVDYINK